VNLQPDALFCRRYCAAEQRSGEHRVRVVPALQGSLGCPVFQES
jgi:hypothetical protein